MSPRRRLAMLCGRLGLALSAAETHGPVRAVGRPIVQACPDSRIVLGPGVTLVSDPRWTALGTSRPVILRTLRAGAELEIGADSGLSGGTICAARHVVLGRRVLAGADVLITDTDFHPVDAVPRRHAPESAADSAPVHIHDDVFLGARVIVLKGVTIGAGTVVGAGSVVTSSLPAGVVAGGNPCRVLRDLALTERG